MNTKLTIAKSETIVDDPPFVGLFLHNRRFTWFWLSARIILGFGFLRLASSHEISQSKLEQVSSLLNSLRTSTPVLEAPHPSIDYHNFYDFFQRIPDLGSQYSLTKLIAFGEFAIGIALIFGVLFATLSLFSLYLNWNIVMIASLSSSIELLTVSILMLLIGNMALYLLSWHIILQRSALIAHDLPEKRKRLPRLTVG